MAFPVPKDEHGRNVLRVEMFRRRISVTALYRAAGVSQSLVSRAIDDEPIKLENQIRLSEACASFPVDPQADALLQGKFADSLPPAEEDS